MRLQAVVFSVAVHAAALAGLLALEPPPRAPAAAPVEVQLVFRAPAARRAPPPPPPLAAPRPARAKRGAPLSAALAPPAPLPPAASAEPGLPTGAGEAAGLGEGGDDDGSDAGTPGGAGDAPERFVEARVLALPRVEYPRRALEEELEGVVRLLVELDAEGRPTAVTVTQSPDPELGRVAREALLRARFMPARRGGEPTAARFEYRYRFELR